MDDQPASVARGFLFADLRNYSAWVESHGDHAAVGLLREYRGLVRQAVAEFAGAEIKTEGDSFYVVFGSPSAAVNCGLRILVGAAESQAAAGGPIPVGIGVHAGETVATDEGYVGSAVNVAARVCAQARAGELLVTDARPRADPHLPQTSLSCRAAVGGSRASRSRSASTGSCHPATSSSLPAGPGWSEGGRSPRRRWRSRC